MNLLVKPARVINIPKEILSAKNSNWYIFMYRVKKHPVGKKENLCKWILQDHLVKLSARFCSFFLKIISWSEPSTINLISLASIYLLYF